MITNKSKALHKKLNDDVVLLNNSYQFITHCASYLNKISEI